MPFKGMRSICFNPQSPSFSHYSKKQSSPSPLLLPNIPESTVDQILDDASNLILKWNPESSTYAKVTSLFHESKSEAKKFLNHVGNIQKLMHMLVNEDSTSRKLVRAQTLMIIAMERLKKEFFQILTTNRCYLDPESVSSTSRSSRASATSSTSFSTSDYDNITDDDDNSITEVQKITSIATSDLKLIAECMIETGYTSECIDIYKAIRKTILDEAIRRIGFEKLSNSQIGKMDWEILESKIRNWLEAMKMSMRLIFHGEQILLNSIFTSSDHIREACFGDISKESASSLFAFPEQVVKKIDSVKFKSSPGVEKLFPIIDMYLSIAENWQNIERIFSFESTSGVRTIALNSLIKLGDSVRSMIADFEQSILEDKSKLTPQGGGVHHLTINTMDFLSLLADYSNVLVDILVDWTPSTKTILSFPEFYFDGFTVSDESGTSTLSTAMAWLIMVLLCKLDGKAKRYKEVWSSYLFLANNLRHIIVVVRTSNLRYLLGDEWMIKYEEKTKQYAASYEKLAWGPVFTSLPLNPTAVLLPRDAREWFRKFKACFEDTCRKQKSSVVPDAKFRDDIKASMTNKLVPVYRKFYDMHCDKLKSGGDQLGVRFSPEDVGNHLSELFSGASSSYSHSMTSSPAATSSFVGIRHLWKFGRFREKLM
ncbi:hypothetical protein ACFE04_020044 [Oxalis oulophora]